MNKAVLINSVLSTILLSACNSTPAKIYTDKPIKAGYKQIIAASVRPRLLDPASGRFTYGAPVKTKNCGDSLWSVPISFSGKNTFGGYAQPKYLIFYFKGGSNAIANISNGGLLPVCTNKTEPSLAIMFAR